MRGLRFITIKRKTVWGGFGALGRMRIMPYTAAEVLPAGTLSGTPQPVLTTGDGLVLRPRTYPLSTRPIRIR